VEKNIGDVCRRAKEAGISFVVLSRASAAVPVRFQTQCVVKNSISSEMWQRIRCRIGGSLSGLTSAAETRVNGRAAFSEIRNRMKFTPTGATLMSVLAAAEALVASSEKLATRTLPEHEPTQRTAERQVKVFGLVGPQRNPNDGLPCSSLES